MSKNGSRKYLPSLSELIDRLAIDQIKEVLIAEHKENYRREMSNILHDINLLLQHGDIRLNAEVLRLIIIIAQMNLHIWYNEAVARTGKDQDLKKLKLTHGLNGIRQKAKNKLLEALQITDGRDFKVDCLAAEFKDWEIQWDICLKRPK